MKIHQYFDLAIQTAIKTTRYKRNFRLGAIAVRKDGAIVKSKNGSTPHPNPKIHAETRVLRKAGTQATLYVARIGKDGTILLARPCQYCMTEIKNKKVKKVYYTINKKEYGVITL